MPAEHRALIERVEALPDLRGLVDRAAYDEALEARSEEHTSELQSPC